MAGQRRRAQRIAARVVPRSRWPFLVLGTVLVVAGLFLFADVQTQALFKDTVDIGRTEGVTVRNDGGIMFASLVASLGAGLVFAALSPRPVHRRLLPLLGFTASGVALMTAHFTIFVNGVIVPGAGSASVKASFLFHDAAAAVPIGPYLLACVTLLLLFGLIVSAMALLTPDLLRNHILRPPRLDALRTQVVAVSLVVLATGAAFTREFFRYAILADANPSDSFFRTNLVVVYYLLALALIGAMGMMAWRTAFITWGDLREAPSRGHRRRYAMLLHTETWLWGILLVLNLFVLMSPAVYQPGGEADRVFAVNSKGVAMFLFLLVGAYLVQRRVARKYHRQLLVGPAAQRYFGRDALSIITSVAAVVYAGVALALLPVDFSPLSKLTIRFAAVALILPFFAFKGGDGREVGLAPRDPGSPIILLFTALLWILVGIMLWGVGNSVTTTYSQSGGFIEADESKLQPYATGIRLLGSLFIAVPIASSLWFVASRFEKAIHPGPLLVVGFSIVIGMNLLLTINPADNYDASIRQTDVLIGFWIVQLTGFDKWFYLLLWFAIAGVGFSAAAVLLNKGLRRRHDEAKAERAEPRL